MKPDDHENEVAEDAGADHPVADPPDPPDPADPADSVDQRRWQRFDKVFPVQVKSTAFGDCQGIARNISAGGIFIEMTEPLPLGSLVRVCFRIPDSPAEMVARGEVKRHYFLHFADARGTRALTGMGVRFTGFDADSEQHLGRTLARLTILH